MPNIRVDVDSTIKNGSEIVFIAPCDCSEITGLNVYYPDLDDTTFASFIFKDAHGNELSDIDNLFVTGVYVKVILNVTEGIAYIQNADTNKYLEGQFNNIQSNLQSKADLESPTLTGIPKAPTAESKDNSTQIATTAFVQAVIASLINGAPSTLDTLKEIADAMEENEDVVNALETVINEVKTMATNAGSQASSALTVANSKASYETGTFSLSYTADKTYTFTNPFNYIKIGKIVFVHGNVQGGANSANFASGIAKFSGLPFAVNAGNEAHIWFGSNASSRVSNSVTSMAISLSSTTLIVAEQWDMTQYKPYTLTGYYFTN